MAVEARRNHSLLMSAKQVLNIVQVIRFKNKCWLTMHLYNFVPIIYATNCKFGIRRENMIIYS